MRYGELPERIWDCLNDERQEAFEALLVAARESGGPDAVKGLILSMRDTEDHHQEMFLIVHTVEDFPRETYFQGLLSALVETPADPAWITILLVRIMNDRPCFDRLVQRLGSSAGLDRHRVRDAFAKAGAVHGDRYREHLMAVARAIAD